MSSIHAQTSLFTPAVVRSPGIEELALGNQRAYELAEAVLVPFAAEDTAVSPDVIITNKTEKYGQFVVARAALNISNKTAHTETFMFKDYTGDLEETVKETGKLPIEITEIPTNEQSYSFTYPEDRIPRLATTGIFKGFRNRLITAGVAQKLQQLNRFYQEIQVIESALVDGGHIESDASRAA